MQAIKGQCKLLGQLVGLHGAVWRYHPKLHAHQRMLLTATKALASAPLDSCSILKQASWQVTKRTMPLGIVQVRGPINLYQQARKIGHTQDIHAPGSDGGMIWKSEELAPPAILAGPNSILELQPFIRFLTNSGFWPDLCLILALDSFRCSTSVHMESCLQVPCARPPERLTAKSGLCRNLLRLFCSSIRCHRASTPGRR